MSLEEVGTVANCRGCNAAITWGVTEEKKRVPLNAEAFTADQARTSRGGVFYVKGGPFEGGTYIERARLESLTPDALVFLSHFATCPEAKRFSGRGRKKGATRAT